MFRLYVQLFKAVEQYVQQTLKFPVTAAPLKAVRLAPQSKHVQRCQLAQHTANKQINTAARSQALHTLYQHSPS